MAGVLTGGKFWDDYHRARGRRVGLPSWFSVLNWDLKRLLRRHIRPGAKVLEIGFAPGSLLAWASRRLRAEVAGLDSSPVGVESARGLFARLGVPADLRCEDLFAPTFPPGQFDLVYSAGVIEHFEDPAPAVRKHVELARPGGVALLTVPNYAGVYGRIQRWFDPENLAAHNLAIMSRDGLLGLAPGELVGRAEAFPAGRLGAWLISFRKRLPRPLAVLARATCHGLGIIQPCRLPGLNSMWVLRLTRKNEPNSKGG